MRRAHGNRVRRGMVLAAAIGAVAVLALSGLAAARGHHGDRHRHGPDTGTIASFDASTGTLAIQQTGGETITGLVTGRTKIRCEDEHAPDVSARARKSGDSSGPGSSSHDNSGRGTEPGDDHGQSAEPGDDHGGRGPSGHDDNGAGANCTASDLIAGTAVHSAELDLRGGKAFWGEVELND